MACCCTRCWPSLAACWRLKCRAIAQPPCSAPRCGCCIHCWYPPRCISCSAKRCCRRPAYWPGCCSGCTGASNWPTDKLGSGLLWSAVGLGGFTLLGVLAKANGALLPLYALLVEAIVLARRQPIPAGTAQRAYRRFLVAVCRHSQPCRHAPIWSWTGIHGIASGEIAVFAPGRIGQRLLTEPRVLLDYLALLWLPRPFSSGLFNDQYIASTSLWHPATTLPAMLAILAVDRLARGWLRQRHPALALAVLFYFAGQLMESTSISAGAVFRTPQLRAGHADVLATRAVVGGYPTSLSTLKRALMIVLPIGLGH